MDWLKLEWKELTQRYFKSKRSDAFWKELEKHYTSKNRYYHNFSHIYNMLKQLETYQSEIEELDNLKIAIWYHDIIYKSTKKDNEEKSALFAKKRLKMIGFDAKQIKNIEKLIISTKKHQLVLTQNIDNAYLLDLDLSILGTEWEIYKIYISNIRKEYKIYPNFIYKPGRIKVLNHFLERDNLYFTKAFQDKYEKQARINLRQEIELL